MRILLAEDDLQLGEGMCLGLKALGHTVDWVRDGISVEQALATESLDVLILDLGADDYVVKPFDLLEVNARLRAICRRREGRAAPVIEHGALRLNPASREVTLNGEPVTLSSYEYAVLEILLTHSGRILSRKFLEESLYGWDEGVESNAVEVYIHHLRKKIDKELIRTVRGVGYTIAKAKGG